MTGKSFAFLMALSSLVVVSCGSDSAAPIVPQDRLDAALLTLDDLGEGWSEELRSVFTSRDEGPPSFDPSGWCPKAQKDVKDLADIEDLAGDIGAAVEFRHERQDTRRMFHGVSQQVWSNTDVDEYFDVLSRAFDICLGETWSPSAEEEVTVSPLESADLGDESLALSISIVTPGPDGDYVWASRMVVVVIDSALMIMRDLDVQLSGSEPFMSMSDWNDLVTKAMTHFTDVVAS